MNTKFVKLSRTIQSEEGDMFKRGSVIEFLTPPTQDGKVEFQPINAFDQSNNPYPETDLRIYSAYFDREDYQLTLPQKRASFGFNTIGFDLSEQEDDSVSLALKEVYDTKGWVVDRDGWILDKQGMRQVRAIDTRKVKTSQDVIEWTKAKIAQRLPKSAILKVATALFDAEWQSVVRAILKDEYGELEDAEDRSLTEKAPEGGTIDAYPHKDESGKVMPNTIIEGRKRTINRLLAKKRRAAVEHSFTEELPPGSNTKQIQSYPGKSNESYMPMRTEALLRKATLLRRLLKVSEKDLGDGTETTLTEGQPSEADKSMPKGTGRPKEARRRTLLRRRY